jgi:hypothetical protein
MSQKFLPETGLQVPQTDRFSRGVSELGRAVARRAVPVRRRREVIVLRLNILEYSGCGSNSCCVYVSGDYGDRYFERLAFEDSIV